MLSTRKHHQLEQLFLGMREALTDSVVGPQQHLVLHDGWAVSGELSVVLDVELDRDDSGGWVGNAEGKEVVCVVVD